MTDCEHCLGGWRNQRGIQARCPMCQDLAAEEFVTALLSVVFFEDIDEGVPGIMPAVNSLVASEWFQVACLLAGLLGSCIDPEDRQAYLDRWVDHAFGANA